MRAHGDMITVTPGNPPLRREHKLLPDAAIFTPGARAHIFAQERMMHHVNYNTQQMLAYATHIAPQQFQCEMQQPHVYGGYQPLDMVAGLGPHFVMWQSSMNMMCSPEVCFYA